MLYLAILILAVLLVWAYFYLRFPIHTGHGDYYFTNYVRVYKRRPYQSSLIRVPDIFPFTRDEPVRGADPFSFKYVGNFTFNPVGPALNTANDTDRGKVHVISLGGSSSNPADYFNRPALDTSGDIYRDKKHVIYGYGHEVVWDSDPDSLRLFNGYAKDKRHVYLHSRVSKKLDPESFELLGCGFYRDRDGVYNDFMGFENVITVIDKDTFEVINPQRCHSDVPYHARDKNHLYKADGAWGFRIIK